MTDDQFNLVLCPYCGVDSKDCFIVTELELQNSITQNPLNGKISYYSKQFVIKCVNCNRFISIVPASKSVLEISYTDNEGIYQTKEY